MPTPKELEAAVEWKVCRRCDTRPRAVWLGSLTGEQAHGYRCSCDEKDEYLNPDIVPAGGAVAHRLGEMMRRKMQRYEDNPTNLIVIPSVADAAAPPMTVAALKQKNELIKAVVADMKLGVHYGEVVKGRGKSLWEPGAEVIRFAFGIPWEHKVVDQVEDYDIGYFRYRVKAWVPSPSGVVMASWEASASSKEKAFSDFEGDLIADIVLDRAIKRAFVNLIRNVTGVSGEFKDATTQADAPVGVPGGAHPLLRHCPEHKRPWRENTSRKDGSVFFSHREGAGWCNRDKAVTPIVMNAIKEAAESAGKSSRDVTEWLKAHADYGQTLSKLSLEKKIDVMLEIETWAASIPEADGDTDDLRGPGAFDSDDSNESDDSDEQHRASEEMIQATESDRDSLYGSQDGMFGEPQGRTGDPVDHDIIGSDEKRF